jgi:WD40 repeat protein
VNTNNPQPITSFEGHTNNVTAVGFERDGRWMYSGSEDGTVKIWDLRASGFQREYESRGAVNSVVLHPNQVRTRRDACANYAAVRAASVCLSGVLCWRPRASFCAG